MVPTKEFENKTYILNYNYYLFLYEIYILNFIDWKLLDFLLHYMIEVMQMKM